MRLTVMVPRRALALLALLAGVGGGLGCAESPGECTAEPAVQSRGWLVLQQSCAGSTCHATAATGPARNNAPSGLDWDDPSTVRDWSDDIWSSVESGFMPPDSWVAQVPDAELESDEREALRQFLACGASEVSPP